MRHPAAPLPLASTMALFLALLLAATVARAEPVPVPEVCARPQVLQAVLARLNRAGRPVRIEPDSVGQVDSRANLVTCAVRVFSTEYDTNQLGRVPIEEVRIYSYTLELGQNAIFLRPEP